MEDLFAAYGEAVLAQDGTTLASLISLRDDHIYVFEETDYDFGSLTLDECKDDAIGALGDVVYYHINVWCSLSSPKDAYHLQLKLFQSIPPRLEKASWLLPVMGQALCDLRLLAAKADRECEDNGEIPSFLKAVVSEIRSIFADLSKEPSLKAGTMSLTVHMFNIAFKQNNTSTMNIASKIQIQDPNSDIYPVADRVQYFYYSGRFALLSSRFQASLEMLEQAFALCPPESVKNRRLILVFLIATNLVLRKRLPRRETLEQYNLLEFEDLVEGVRTGNISLLHRAKETHSAFFVQWGILLMIDRLYQFAYRNLFKKV
jgi:hypothetical protein